MHGLENDPEIANAMEMNKALVGELKMKGCIRTREVEAAFRSVLRHHFVRGVPLEKAYSDNVVPIKQNEAGQWISSSSQPAIMAIMLEQLDLQPGQNVLEIGTGTGYNAALIAHLVGEKGRVVTIDIDEDLVEAARQNLQRAGYERVQVVCTDGGYGYPAAAPFDRIILTVGAHDITPAWWQQLKSDGCLVLPLVLRGSMKSVAFVQQGDHLTSRSVQDCGFILLRGDFASAAGTRIPLGPNPALYLEPEGKLLLSSAEIYALLTEPQQDWPADVQVTAWDVLNGPLWTWLALREPAMSKLVAEGGIVEKNLVPPLIGIEARQRSAGTVVLVEKTGLAALMRPPGEMLPMGRIESLFNPESPTGRPFPLYVRGFGSDETAARHLLEQVRAWDAAGRPPSTGMHIRAYPKDVEYKPAGGEFVIEKEWTRLVISWPGSR